MSNATQQMEQPAKYTMETLPAEFQQEFFNIVTKEKLGSEEAIAVINQRNLEKFEAAKAKELDRLEEEAATGEVAEDTHPTDDQAKDWKSEGEVSIPTAVMDRIVMDYTALHFQMDGQSKYLGKRYYGRGRGNGYTVKFFAGNIRVEHIKNPATAGKQNGEQQ